MKALAERNEDGDAENAAVPLFNWFASHSVVCSLQKNRVDGRKSKLGKLEADNFKDAVQEDDDVIGILKFRVSEEELAIIRAELAAESPDDFSYLLDSYFG
jgi:hypothetical protein